MPKHSPKVLNNFWKNFIFDPQHFWGTCPEHVQEVYLVITYDIISYDIISYDIIWCDMISYDIIGYDIIWYVMISHDIIWYEFMLYDIIWYYMTWFDKLRCTFWTCSGHAPKKFGGQKWSFSKKCWGPLGYVLASSVVSKSRSTIQKSWPKIKR